MPKKHRSNLAHQKTHLDYKTIADFRKDNAACIKGVFKEFVKLCMGLNLYGAKLIGIDGSKFKAVNAIDKDLNQKASPNG